MHEQETPHRIILHNPPTLPTTHHTCFQHTGVTRVFYVKSFPLQTDPDSTVGMKTPKQKVVVLQGSKKQEEENIFLPVARTKRRATLRQQRNPANQKMIN